MTKFSIIIPVYNVAPYLRECLDSVLAQTFANWEAICVDDGSTDGSGTILDEYAAKDKRFRVIHQANAGVSAARNVALDVMKGEWVGFLDADDVLSPWMLQSIDSSVKHHPEADIHSFKLRAFQEGNFIKWQRPIVDSVSVNSITKTIDRLVPTSCFSGKIYFHSLVKTVRFSSFIVGEDILFIYEVLEQAACQVDLNVELYGYRQRSSSVTHQRISGRIIESEIMYAAEVLKIMAFSKKVYHKSLFRQYCNFEVEHVAYSLLSLHKHEFNNLKKLWKKKIIELSKYKIIGLFHRMRMKVIGLFCWRIVILVLAQFPHWLKRKGLHR